MSKPAVSYADLIKRRAPQKTRTVRRPLCLDMSLWDAYNEAKKNHSAAVEQERIDKAAGTKPAPSKYGAKTPLEQATEALNAAAEAMWAMSLWIVLTVPSAIEQDKMIAELEKRDYERGGTQWIIDYLLACFDHATDVEGNRVEDFTAATLRSELEGDAEEGRPGRTMGELLAMQKPIVDAIVSTDFPTPPKP